MAQAGAPPADETAGRDGRVMTVPAQLQGQDRCHADQPAEDRHVSWQHRRVFVERSLPTSLALTDVARTTCGPNACPNPSSAPATSPAAALPRHVLDAVASTLVKPRTG